MHTCSTIEEAQSWVSEQLKGREIVDADHQSTEDVMTSSKTARYQVYDGDPVTVDKDGEPNLVAPVYESDCFYTD